MDRGKGKEKKRKRKGGKASNFVDISIVIKVIYLTKKSVCGAKPEKKFSICKSLHPLEDKQLQSDTARTILQG